MVKDFYDIKQAIQPIVDKLDHQHLGEGEVIHFNGMEPDYKVWLLSTVEGMIPGFTPTSENLLIWIASQIPTTLPWCKLEINETCTSSAVLERWEHTRYFLKEGGNHGRQEEGDEEGRQEGKEVPAQEGKKVASPPIDIDAYIRDDDIPF
jgi:6-pyruvoyl-tetrahydropterin synthase